MPLCCMTLQCNIYLLSWLIKYLNVPTWEASLPWLQSVTEQIGLRHGSHVRESEVIQLSEESPSTYQPSLSGSSTLTALFWDSSVFDNPFISDFSWFRLCNSSAQGLQPEHCNTWLAPCDAHWPWWLTIMQMFALLILVFATFVKTECRRFTLALWLLNK